MQVYNFVSDKFCQFCKSVNIEQATSSAYHHQSNGQVKACIKCMFKKCADSGCGINMALLQIQTTPLGHSLPRLAMLMFNRPVCSLIPVIDHKPLVEDCDDDCHAKIIKRQQKNNNDTAVTFSCIPIRSAVVAQWTMDSWDCSKHRQPQPSWKVLHNTINNQWQMHHMQQTPHQANSSNTGHIHTIPVYKRVWHKGRPTGRNVK